MVTHTATRFNLYRALAAVAPHQSRDITREHLNAVLVELHQSCARFVATDGHSMAIVDIETTRDTTEWREVQSVVLRTVQVEMLLKTLKPRRKERDQPITMQIEGNELIINGAISRQTLATDRHLTFPPYQVVTPERYTSGKADYPPAKPTAVSPENLMKLAQSARAFDTGDSFPLQQSAVTGSLEPIRYDCETRDGCSMIVIVMPMRC